MGKTFDYIFMLDDNKISPDEIILDQQLQSIESAFYIGKYNEAILSILLHNRI